MLVMVLSPCRGAIVVMRLDMMIVCVSIIYVMIVGVAIINVVIISS